MRGQSQKFPYSFADLPNPSPRPTSNALSADSPNSRTWRSRVAQIGKRLTLCDPFWSTLEACDLGVRTCPRPWKSNRETLWATRRGIGTDDCTPFSTASLHFLKKHLQLCQWQDLQPICLSQCPHRQSFATLKVPLWWRSPIWVAALFPPPPWPFSARMVSKLDAIDWWPAGFPLRSARIAPDRSSTNSSSLYLSWGAPFATAFRTTFWIHRRRQKFGEVKSWAETTTRPDCSTGVSLSAIYDELTGIVDPRWRQI